MNKLPRVLLASCPLCNKQVRFTEPGALVELRGKLSWIKGFLLGINDKCQDVNMEPATTIIDEAIEVLPS